MESPKYTQFEITDADNSLLDDPVYEEIKQSKDQYFTKVHNSPEKAIEFPIPSDTMEQILVDRLKQCVSEARENYSQWYASLSSYNIGILHRHTQPGQDRAKSFCEEIDGLDNLDGLKTHIIGFFNDPNLRANPHSFVSFFFNALQQRPLLIEGLNLFWFAGKQNLYLDFDNPVTLKRKSPQKSSAQTELHSLLGNHQQRVKFCHALQCFKSLNQEPVPYVVQQIKTVVSTACYLYHRNRHNMIHEHTYNLHVVETASPYLGLLFPPLHYVIIGLEIGSQALGFGLSHQSGFFSTHGTPGLNKARQLEHAVSRAEKLSDIRTAFDAYFSETHGFGRRTNANKHSFSRFLFYVLSHYENLIDYLNEQWFANQLSLPKPEQILGYQRPYDNISGEDYSPIETELKTAFSLFMEQGDDGASVSR